MGTSGSYKGLGGGKPLVPSWLPNGEGGGGGPQKPEPPAPLSDSGAPAPPTPLAPSVPGPSPGIPNAPRLPPLPKSNDVAKFSPARNNFTRFVTSGGRDRASLGRAISYYVSTSSRGSSTAARRMGASRQTSARLASVLSGVVANGPRATLRSLNLESLAGRPIEEIFLGLMDYVCPEGGSIDDSIAREAFVETIADLGDNGVTDFDGLSAEQLQTVLELYAAHAIETRLCNDIGTKAVSLPSNAATAAKLQEQLFDFIRRSVSDAVTTGLSRVGAMTPDQALGVVTGVYEQAFDILQTMAEIEEDKK